MKKISFTVDGQKINGTLVAPENVTKKLPAVLFIHGWQSSEKGYLPRAEAVSKLGYICLTFSMRGHGDSEGDPETLSGKNHLDDCIAAYDFLMSQEFVDPDNINIVGASYGGYLTSRLSNHRSCKTVVLRAPALYPDKDFTTSILKLNRNDLLIYRQKNLSHTQNKAIEAIHEFSGSMLIIESEGDTIVPKETVRNYIEAADPKLVTHVYIPGADHQLSQDLWKQQFIDLLVDWFRKQKL